MSGFMERVTIFCFAASYGVALLLDVWHQLRPRPILRMVSLAFGAAGLLAHTLYVLVQPLSIAEPLGSVLFLAWILAVFYLYGSIHHSRLTWGLFVLPLVLGLVILAAAFAGVPGQTSDGFFRDLVFLRGERFWGAIHGTLILLSAVGLSVAFIASLMYLVQAHRLKTKSAPLQGPRLFSLERLEMMNRRAILLSFPLLTAGLLVGVALQFRSGVVVDGWTSPKIVSAVGLWVVFAILLYLRYGAHAAGRLVAWLTMLAYGVMLVVLLTPVHPFIDGGAP